MLKITGKMSERTANQVAKTLADAIKFFLLCVGVAIFLYACSHK